MEKAKRDNQIYKARLLIRIGSIAVLPIIVLVGSTLAIVGLTYRPDDAVSVTFTLITLVLSLSILSIGLAFFHLAFRTRLVLKPDGLEYHYLGVNGFSSWEDVQQLEVRIKFKGNVDFGLALEKSPHYSGRFSSFFRSMHANYSDKFLSLQPFVSIQGFPNSQIETHLRTYLKEATDFDTKGKHS
jgi:hypothetical protein